MKSIGFLGMLIMALAIAPGCSNPCDDLQEACDRCSDADQELCQLTVDANNLNGCATMLSMYDLKCP